MTYREGKGRHMKLKCPCGHLINDEKNHGFLLSGTRWRQADDIVSSDWIRTQSRDVVECLVCGRIAISCQEWKDCRVKWFAPEDGKYAGITKR